MTKDNRREDGLGLTGKVAIVTGGGAADDGIGNGRAAAILLARAGAKVLVVDLDRERAARTVAMIEAEGGTAAPFVADVTDELQASAMVAEALARFGRLDCLDNNVGISGPRQSDRGGSGAVAPGHAGQCREHVHRLAPCDPGNERDSGRRSHRQRFLYFRPAAARPDPLFDIERCGDRADAGHGGRPRAGRYPRQLRRARAGLHADGLFAADDPRGTRGAAPGLGARYRGNRLGHWLRCPLPSVS